MYVRLGPEGVGAEFKVTSVNSPILSMEKLTKQGHRFEAGPTGCNMSKGGSQCGAGRCEEISLGGRWSLHDG